MNTVRMSLAEKEAKLVSQKKKTTHKTGFSATLAGGQSR